MPPKVISSTYFKPIAQLTSQITEDLSVKGLGSACLPDLKDRGWTGLAAGYIGIPFYSDNKRLQDAKFFLAGNPHGDEEYLQFKAKKFFQNADPDLTIAFKFKDLSLFEFGSTLTSDYRDSSDVNWAAFHPSKELDLSLPEYSDLGGCDFSIRAYAIMTTKIYFNLYIMIYPRGEDSLFLEFPRAAEPGFPGQLVVTYSIPLLPNADIRYGLAFYAFLLKGDPKREFAKDLSFPVRNAISSLLQTGLAPNSADSKESLLKLWEPLAGEKGTTAAISASTPFLWPDAQRGEWEPAEEGRPSRFLVSSLIFFYLIRYLFSLTVPSAKNGKASFFIYRLLNNVP